MGFLDENKLGEMTQEELIRLIKRTIHQEVPPIPAGVAKLPDSVVPLVPVGVPTNGQVVTYDQSTGQYTPVTPTSATVSTDGAAPAAAGTPIAQGAIDSLQVRWTPVTTNASSGPQRDTVIYDVHVSAAGAGFTPGAGTKVGETPGTSAFIYKDGAGTLLSYSTDYWVKIVARDADGSASASAAAGPVQLVQVTDPDIASNQILARHILAGEVTADKLESVMSLATAFLAGNFLGANVQVGFGTKDDGAGNPVIDTGFIGIRAFDGVNADPVFKLPADGSPAQFRGVVKFGTSGKSKLLQNDMIQLFEQSGGAFATPQLIQSATWTWPHGILAPEAEFENPVTVGNVVVGVLTHWDAGGAGTHTLDGGWTGLDQLTWADSSNARTQMFGKVATGTNDGSPGDGVTVTISKTADVVTFQIFEFSGLTIVENVTSLTAETTSNGVQTLNTTNTGSVTQQALVLGLAMAQGNKRSSRDPSPSFPSIRESSYPADKTFIGQAEEDDEAFGPLIGGNDIETNVFMQVVSSGAQNMIAETNADCLSGAVMVVVLEAAVNQVEPAEANTARLYAADVSGNTYLHATDEDGREQSVVLGAPGEVFRMELFSKSIDVASTAAHTGGSQTLTGMTGLAVGDYCIWIGSTTGSNQFNYWTEPICGTAGEISFHRYNSDAGSGDPPSATHYFLFIHRS